MGSQKINNFVKFSKEQKSILIGTILGDAYLQKTGSKNARLRLEHGINQKDYLFWKLSKLNNLFQGKPKYLERKHLLTGRIYKYFRHQSNSMPELGKLRNIFYKNGKKIIPENLAELVNNYLILAVWYMDDGYYYQRDKVSYLYLGKIMYKEAEIVKSLFEKNFDIHVKILNKNKKGFVIYFPPKETIKFHNKIRKFILPMFNYKLSV